MCITKVAKVLNKNGKRALVIFLGDDVNKDIDISMLSNVRKNSYVEVFSDIALSVLTPKEALARRKLWVELRKIATR